MKNLNSLFCWLFFLFFCNYAVLHAAPLDISKERGELFHKVVFFLDSNDLNISQIEKKSPLFQTKKSMNFGFVDDKSLWVKLSFYNPLDKNITKILQIRNPLLEDVVLYESGVAVEHKGSLQKEFKELHHSFSISLYPHESKIFYLKIKNITTTLRLGLFLKEPSQFLEDECSEEKIIFIFFTILIMLMLYNLLLTFYLKERTYLYYSLYLFALLFQQSTYLGITQIYFPSWFVYYDNLGVVFKVNLMYIAAIVFARSFLQTQRYITIDKGYKILLFLGLVEIPLFGTSWFYFPQIAIVTGLVFIFYNMYASLYILKQGYKQARFFVLGWIFQLIGFTLMILDGLGFISVMDKVPELVMFFTSIEAVLLSLAFVDRFSILKKAKQKSDIKLIEEMQNRQTIVENEIQKATKDLHHSLENEKNLLKELHHRTKNNLQLILSLLRMQSDRLSAHAKTPFKLLEGRINAIAKAQELLYLRNDFEAIDMHLYIEELCYHLEHLSEKTFACSLDIERLFLPIKEASSFGLIVNELVTNSIKYVQEDSIVIQIQMYKEKEHYIFIYSDNGRGITEEVLQKKRLGIALVKMLVEEQLEGELLIETQECLRYTIRFEL